MKHKILIIDDDPTIVQVLHIRLKFAGYEVLTAPDGVQGLALAMESKPDLVILDIWMPLGGGFSVAHRLREQAPEIPFMFITASKKAGLRQMADSLGAAAFLEKPYEKEDLLAAVAKALKAKPASPAGSGGSEACQEPGRAIPNPRPEDRRPKETRSPKSELIATPAEPPPIESGHSRNSDFGLRSSDFRAAEPDLPATGPTLEPPQGPGVSAPPHALSRQNAGAPPQSPAVTAPASVAAPRPKSRITGRNKILIVEDDRRIAMALTVRLQNAGQEVVQAFDAASGVAAASQHQPDLILMDISLPGGSGLIAAQRIQSVLPKLTPIVFVTASKQPGLRQKALALGAAGFLEKPYEPQDLLTTIEGALRAAAAKGLRSAPSAAPTTPEHAIDLRLANLEMVAPARSAPHRQPELAGITGRHKILIVEDDRRNALALATGLGKAGQEVIPAGDETSGVAAAIQHQPDLILMSLDLPGGSGLMAAQKIQRALPKLTPMIFLTAGKQPGLRQKALALAAAGFLEKPYTIEDLLATIQNALCLGRGDDPTRNEGFYS